MQEPYFLTQEGPILGDPSTTPSLEAVHSSDLLCSSCRWDLTNLPTTTALTRRSGEITKSMSRLEEGKREGCWVCKALLSAMELWNNPKYEKVGWSWQPKIRFDKERVTLSGPAQWPKLQLFCPEGEPGVYRFNADSELPRTAISPVTTNFISSNLNTCMQEHPNCHDFQDQLKPGVNDNWPSRILSIDKDTFTVSLVDFDESMRAKYIALSYCWGNSKEQLTATKGGLPSLQAGINISQLPATLQDAVKVTINLGQSLIWIDSLCIIQDDEEDWNMEAGKMSTVYAQSLVTIIASSADSCSRGFLDTPREQSVQVAQVCVNDKATQVRARPLYEWGHHRGGPQAHEMAHMRWFDPADGRGWTLQERLLSARYINFTSGEAQWGCLSARACECGQELYGELYVSQNPENDWFRDLKEFSLRRLTAVTDKSAAMAGMARKVSVDLEWDWYGAGLWLKKEPTQLVVRSLLWSRNLAAPVSAFPAEFVAPSFSCLSITDEVAHMEPKELAGGTFTFQVNGVGLSFHSADTFGRVDQGVLRVQGQVLEGELSWNATRSFTSEKGDIAVKVDGRTQTTTCNSDGLLELVALPDGRHTARRKLVTRDEPEVSFKGADIVLLPIMSYLTGFVRSLVPTEKNDCSVCLVLGHSSIHKGGYERLGLCEVKYEKLLDGVLQEVCIY